MRHNLLIVDDEELIRQGLRARIKYLQIEVDEIYEASNGREAVLAVQNNPVDLVITDIRMPDMDGLTMIAEIQKIRPEIQFIVMSGYAEFSYAETAIRLGVKAYLLKPLSNEELKETFEKVYHEMEKNRTVRNAQIMEKKLNRERQVYQLEKEINAFFSGTENGMILMRQMESILTDSPVKFSESSCIFLGVISVDHESYEHDNFRQMDHELVRFSVKNVFYEVEPDCNKIIVNSVSDHNMMYAMFFGEDERKLRHDIERVFWKMETVLEKKMDIYISFGISRCKRELLQQSVKEANEALKQRIICGNSNLYFYDDIKLFNQNDTPVSQINLLNRYMEKKDIHKIKILLEEMFDQELMRNYGLSYLRMIWVQILNVLFRHYDKKTNNSSGIEKLLLNLNLPEQMHSLPEIQQQMTDLIMECIRLDDMSEINAKSKMHMAVRYIQEHYNENISVNDLAERYDMSSNYFSAIFKKEQHQSPVDYITTLRVKKAMELLECSDKSVVDIAKKVGYEEASYFYRVFKKYTGMTPLHYREQHR
jgi:YesN/AraC family two-component response regulator